MAISATLGLAGNGQRKRMSAVAYRTGALRSIRIEPPDTFVGPCGWVQFPLSNHLHFAAVTLLAAHGSGRRAFYIFSQHIVERTEDLPGLCVMAGLEFVGLLRVACAARLRRNHDRYAVVVMIEGVRPRFVCLVALIAADADLSVAAGGPLLHCQRRRSGLVACNARLTLLRGTCRGLCCVRNVLPACRAD